MMGFRTNQLLPRSFHFFNFSQMIRILLCILASISSSYFEEAAKLLHQGNFQEALQKYDLAIEQDPTNHVIYYQRATAYMISGLNDRALTDLNSVLTLKKDNYAVFIAYVGPFEEIKTLAY